MNRKQAALARLHGIRERNELREEQMEAMRPRFEALAGRANYKSKVVSSHNLFPTPPDVARSMVDLACVTTNHRVLEPSAGTGRLLDAIPAGCPTVAVEICPQLNEYLFHNYPRVLLKCGDFMDRTVEDMGTFDRIIMNPPFERGEDIKHIMHARKFLAPGGMLVSLCFDGVKQNKQLKPIAFHWQRLTPGSFKREGTSAGVVMLSLGGY